MVSQDLDDLELVSNTWTGVVPVNSVVGEPQPTAYSRKGAVPEHVKALK